MTNRFRTYLTRLMSGGRDDARRCAELEALLREREGRIADLAREIAVREGVIRELRSSLSWRLTAPLRSVGALALWLAGRLDRIRRLLPRRASGMNKIINRERRRRCLSRRFRRSAAAYPRVGSASVVIPTKNAGPEFRETLRRIADQKGVEHVEIVVIDSGSTDGTVEVARDMAADVVAIPPDSFHHARTRNLGAERASGEHLVFLVQDAVPVDDRWLQKLLVPLQRGEAAAVTTRQVPRWDADLFICWAMYHHYNHLKLRRGRFSRRQDAPKKQTIDERRGAGSLDNVCMAIGRDLFLRYRFDPQYAFAEDLDLGLRLYDAGYTLLMQEDNAVIHSHRRAAAYHLRRHYADRVHLSKLFALPRGDASLESVWGEAATLYRAICHSLQPLELWEGGRTSCRELVDRVLCRVEEYAASSVGHASPIVGDPSLDRVFSERRAVVGRSSGLFVSFAATMAQIAEYVDDVCPAIAADEIRDAVFKCFASRVGDGLFVATRETDTTLIEGV